MKLRWTVRARKDLLAIGQYIRRNNPKIARTFVERLRGRAKTAVDMPFAGRIVPEFNREDIREFIEGNYRIVYHIQNEFIYVLTVFEGHRQIQLEMDTITL